MGAFRHAIPTWAVICSASNLLFLFTTPVLTTTVGPSTPSAADRSAASRWPQSFVAENGAILTIAQPQIADWRRESMVTFYAAVAYRPRDARNAALGTVVAEADTALAFHERLVRLSRLAVVDANFPTLPNTELTGIVALIEKTLATEERAVTLDDVLAAVDSRPPAPENVATLRTDPPLVFVSKRPAVLLNIDGMPIWRAIDGAGLLYAVNTNWDLFRDIATNSCYLRDGRVWLTTRNILGPWTRARALPADFNRLPSTDRWKDVRAALPATREGATPDVFISREPAELIVFEGEPTYRLVPGTAKLQWVNNTDSDVFREGITGTVYYLVAGRWFAAPEFSGPWSFATDRLPADFRKIPLDHPRSHVLASVPGTIQARDALVLAQVPTLARVNKKGLKAPAIAYDGAPTFLPIPETSVARAVNTDKDVIKAGLQYYLCYDGVWFVATMAQGPWKVTGSVPAALYRIPPSSPLHRVTYVTVDEDYEDWTVFATTPAYEGTMITGDSVVWGTGYVYPSYLGGSLADPLYFRRPSTYGTGAWYNPWTASFGHAHVGYGPAAGSALSAQSYASWDPQLLQTDYRWRDRSNATPKAVGTAGHLTAQSVRAALDGGIYAGRDGSVYRQGPSGWQKFHHGAWVATHRGSPNDAPILRQLDDDARARREGVQRRRNDTGLQNEWGPRAASYHPASSDGRGAR